jgi:dTDP-glucose 4,6-dehydratase
MANTVERSTYSSHSTTGSSSRFDTADVGGVQQRAQAVAHHHDFARTALIPHERSPINPVHLRDGEGRADFLTMNYHDAYGVPGVVTRMFNNYAR